MSTLAERLGHRREDRLLILSCDNLGLALAANDAVYESLHSGLATSAGLMVPCPWARDAAHRYEAEDVGVHLTLNAELDTYRWGPITQAPSLLDGDGGFPRALHDLWDHADVDEVRRECRAQIERAGLWGLDVSHLSSHRNALPQRPELFDVYLELAVALQLPIRLGGAGVDHAAGFPVRQLAAAEGVLSPDHLVVVRGRAGRRVIEGALMDLEPGVTEIAVEPAIDRPELRAFEPDWAGRVEHYLLVNHDRAVRDLVERSGVHLVGWQAIREAQVKG